MKTQSTVSSALAFKVISLNMWHGGRHLMEEALAFLERENADIVILQEVYNGTDPDLTAGFRTTQVLRERLRYPYEDFAPAFLELRDEGKIEQGNSVLSRFPIVARDVTFLSESYRPHPGGKPEFNPTTPRALQHVTLETPAGEVNVFNFQGVWDMDGDRFSEQRRKMSEIILAAVKGKPNVIVAGDTNAKPTNKAMVALESELKSVFGTSLTTTFNMKHKTNPGYATAAVDLMYVSDGIKVVEAACLDVDVSDHQPLAVRLRL